jgi:hypothetical protein
MGFTITLGTKKEQFEKKVTLLSLIQDDDPLKKQYVCAKVNNRVREIDI